MKKDELIKLIQNLNLSEELETTLIKTVNEKELTPQLLNDIADILEFQADLHDKEAKSLVEEAQIYNKLADQLEEIDLQQAEELGEIFDEAKQKIAALKTDVTKQEEETKTQDELEKARQDLTQTQT